MGCIYSKTDNGDIETTTEAYECLDKVRNCKKNPTHEQFYSLAELTVDILPEECRTEQWVEYIRLLSKLVVRLTVYKSDGTRLYGTGYVVKSQYNSNKFYIRTNHHVVGSKKDVSNCDIDFFYDTVDRTGIVTSKGVELLRCSKKRDLCDFTFNPVPQTIKQFMSDLKSIDPPPDTHRHNIIAISHPHGGPKMVTIGERLCDKDDDGVKKRVHTARTCPGASGCPILDTKYAYSWSDWRYNWYYTHYAGKRSEEYKGRHSDTSNVNYSV